MPELMEFPLAGGDTILVAVEGPSEPPVRGWGDRPTRAADEAHQTFEAALARVRPAAEAVVAAVADLQPSPQEISVEFAVQVTAEAGVYIAKLGSSANFKIALTWKSG